MQQNSISLHMQNTSYKSMSFPRDCQTSLLEKQFKFTVEFSVLTLIIFLRMNLYKQDLQKPNPNNLSNKTDNRICPTMATSKEGHYNRKAKSLNISRDVTESLDLSV